VPIRASSSKQIDALVADLLSGSSVQREAAVARLTVLGARAVERLVAIADGDAEPSARAAAFRALEAIADPRAVDAAMRGMASPDSVLASAAIGAARVFIRGPRGAAIVDAMTTVAINEDRPDDIRVTALRALMELERSTIAPLLERLADDPSARVRSELSQQPAPGGRQPAADPAEVLARIAKELPDDPRVVHAVVTSAGETGALPLLLSVIERIRERERTEPAGRRMEWTTARAAAHHALAKRGSRIALYDLRESLAGAREPLPVEFVSALSAIGDASCLEPLAGAYTRAAGDAAARDDWWRSRLGDAFRTIVAREKITRRHAAVKRIEKRWKGAVQELWGGAGRAGGAGGAGGR
jgi:HEAT repeat protein